MTRTDARPLLISIALLLLLLAVAALAPGGARATGWSAPEFPVKGEGYVGAMAGNARGDLVLAGTDHDRGVMVVERPAGGPFGTPVTVTPDQHTFGVRAAINARGDEVVAWTRAPDASNHVAQYAVRPAGGSFGPIVTLPGGPPGGLDGVRVGIDDAGEVAVAWTSYVSTTDHSLLHYAMTDASGALGPIHEGGETADYESWFDVRVDGSGDAVVAWTQAQGGEDVVRTATRAAGGAFGAPATIAGSGPKAYMSHLALGADGRVAIAWTQRLTPDGPIEAAFRPAGGSFTAPVPVTSGAAVGTYPRIALSDDAVVVTWADEDAHGVVARLGAFGHAFTTAPQAFPGYPTYTGLAMLPDGHAVMTWAAPPETGYRYVLHAALRAPGGPFVETGPVADDGSSIVANTDDLGAVLDGAGDAFVTWTGADWETGFSTFDAASGYPLPPADDAGDGDTPATVAHPPSDGAPEGHLRGVAAGAPFTTALPARTAAACVVPHLAGLSYARAKARLHAAHCRMGSARRPRGRRTTKGLVVRSQSRRAGARLRAGAAVDVGLRARRR